MTTTFAIAVLVILAIMFLLALAVVYLIVKGTLAAWRYFRAKALTTQATVVGERSPVRSGDNDATTKHFATFEFADGNRIELRVPREAAGQLAVGDQGTLYWQGTRFNGFQRETPR